MLFQHRYLPELFKATKSRGNVSLCRLSGSKYLKLLKRSEYLIQGVINNINKQKTQRNVQNKSR